VLQDRREVEDLRWWFIARELATRAGSSPRLRCASCGRLCACSMIVLCVRDLRWGEVCQTALDLSLSFVFGPAYFGCSLTHCSPLFSNSCSRKPLPLNELQIINHFRARQFPTFTHKIRHWLNARLEDFANALAFLTSSLSAYSLASATCVALVMILAALVMICVISGYFGNLRVFVDICGYGLGLCGFRP